MVLIALVLGTRNRAPLGAKTTNAKTKAFQTPAPAPIDGGQGKTVQKSVSARKPKPKVSHPETTKLEDILADKEALAGKEIEYMPPNPKGSQQILAMMDLTDVRQICQTSLMITMHWTSPFSRDLTSLQDGWRHSKTAKG